MSILSQGSSITNIVLFLMDYLEMFKACAAYDEYALRSAEKYLEMFKDSAAQDEYAHRSAEIGISSCH